MERAERVLDGVLARAAGQRFDKTGKRVGERNVRARLGVRSDLPISSMA